MDELQQTEKHKLYGRHLHSQDRTPVIAIGSAGTGKTYGAVGAAIDWLEKDPTNIFIGARPNVAFADDIGFLPGTEAEKIAPWVRPMRQNFEKHGMDSAYLNMLEQKRRVQFHALAFIQGMTFDNAFIMIDEVQNMSFGQLKGVLTRVGQNSRVVLCGDIKQTSSMFEGSGLSELIDMVRAVESKCHVVEFGAVDILRSTECKRWILDFEKWENQ